MASRRCVQGSSGGRLPAAPGVPAGFPSASEHVGQGRASSILRPSRAEKCPVSDGVHAARIISSCVSPCKSPAEVAVVGSPVGRIAASPATEATSFMSRLIRAISAAAQWNTGTRFAAFRFGTPCIVLDTVGDAPPGNPPGAPRVANTLCPQQKRSTGAVPIALRAVDLLQPRHEYRIRLCRKGAVIPDCHVQTARLFSKPIADSARLGAIPGNSKGVLPRFFASCSQVANERNPSFRDSLDPVSLHRLCRAPADRLPRLAGLVGIRRDLHPRTIPPGEMEAGIAAVAARRALGRSGVWSKFWTGVDSTVSPRSTGSFVSRFNAGNGWCRVQGFQPEAYPRECALPAGRHC